MTKECKAAAEYLMAHSDDWFEDGVREEFNRLEDIMLTAELEVLLEECYEEAVEAGIESRSFEQIAIDNESNISNRDRCYAFQTAQECKNCPGVDADGSCPLTQISKEAINVILGADITEEQFYNLEQRQDELLNEWLVDNQIYFDSKKEAIEYYAFCQRGGQCD